MILPGLCVFGKVERRRGEQKWEGRGWGCHRCWFASVNSEQGFTVVVLSVLLSTFFSSSCWRIVLFAAWVSLSEEQ